MVLLSSNLLSAYLHVDAHFTTRYGGVSQPPYNALNLAFHVGDNPKDVLENHRLLGETLNYDSHKLIHMDQIHSNIVTLVDSTMNFNSQPTCDALVTNCVNIPLMVMSADCTPILIYDPKNHAIAAVHAGRAGALNSILPKTLETMTKNYGTALSDIQITFGPSIHGCCYEINEDIAREVKEKGYKEALIHTKEKVSLDVNAILYAQLKILGITEKQIEAMDECTSCHSHDYFSYRAHEQHTGRIAGVILLRPLPS